MGFLTAMDSMQTIPHRHVGRSRSVLLVLSAIALAALIYPGCGGLRLPLRPQPRPADWWTFGRAPDRNAVVTADFRPPLTAAWSADISAGIGRGSPVVTDSTIFVGTLKGEVYALRMRDGYQLGRVGLAGAIDGSPTVISGSVLVASAYPPRSLVRFDIIDGVPMWEAACGDLEATPLVVGDRIFVGNTVGVFTCVDVYSGTVHWTFSLPENDRLKGIRSAAAAFDSLVIFGAEDGVVYALGAKSGLPVWTSRTGSVIAAPPVVADSTVILCTLDGHVFAFGGPTGSTLWSRAVDGGVTGPAVIAEGKVIVTTLRGCIEALDRTTGAPVWKATPATPMNSGGVVAGTIFYAGTLTKELLAVRLTDGEIVWRTHLAGRVKSGPAFACGRLLLATDAQTIVAFTTQRSQP